MTLAATSAGFVMVPGSLKVIMKMATPKRYTDPQHMLNIGPDIYGGTLRMNREILRQHAAVLRERQERAGIPLSVALRRMGWTSVVVAAKDQGANPDHDGQR